ncbi:polysaccharide deacetylase family protein [Streptomyces sp. URMC 123]|uniref:polysaccharide deacetylase family protein n=1 Tax=Streptomyces sp. URMC 123 TaxID=3423403 RepID=UPI003F1CA13B
MITLLSARRAAARRFGALCLLLALGPAVAACQGDGGGNGGKPGAGASPAPSASPGRSAAASPSAAPATPGGEAVPTLPPGPGGAMPVFEHGPRDVGKVVALTFDADMTSDQGARAASGERFDNPELIATLRRLKVPATIFMTGRWAEQYGAQARSLGLDPLFEVANHSYSHHAFTTPCHGLPALAPESARADVERAFSALRSSGVPEPVPYFRFPGGCHDDRTLRALGPTGATAVQWDVVGGDAFATSADRVTRQVLSQVRPGSVVVLHCTRSAAPVTEEAVRRIVPELRARGYRFAKVSELIGARPN